MTNNVKSKKNPAAAALGRLVEDQMKVIAHQAIGVNLPFGLAAGFRQGGQEHAAIPHISKNWLPAIPPVHHMVDRSGKFTAHLARHTPTMPQHTQLSTEFKK
jgi:hypothetical protein